MLYFQFRFPIQGIYAVECGVLVLHSIGKTKEATCLMMTEYASSSLSHRVFADMCVCVFPFLVVSQQQRAVKMRQAAIDVVLSSKPYDALARAHVDLSKYVTAKYNPTNFLVTICFQGFQYLE